MASQPGKTCKKPLQPNAHPYAIKTTTSALLSRSTSSPHHAYHARHHYIPSSAPPLDRLGLGVSTGMTRGRHRHSSSLSAVHDGAPSPSPSPLPIQSSTVAESYEPKLTHRVRRADTMPSGATVERHDYNQPRAYDQDQASGPELGSRLPSNPKRWNTNELITYLETSFTSGNNTVPADKDDPTLVDIVEYIRTYGLTGRELLRITDGDLASTPLSDVQRAQLLQCSRALRADVLRGRIYVDSHHSHEAPDNSNDVYTLSPRSSTPFRSIRGTSVSADDLKLLPVDDTSEDASALPLTPAVSLHRSNSVSDASESAQRYRDLARMRMRRRGKVKGLVETWERTSTSGSECSASEDGSLSGSEAESESEIGPQLDPISDANRLPAPSSELPSAVYDAPHNDICPDSMGQEAPLLTPPPPYTHVCMAHDGVGDEEEEEELTMEELLASSSNTPLKGARAWEADFGLGETVKRIPPSASADTEKPPLPMESKPSRDPKDNARQTRGDSVRLKSSGLPRGSTRSAGKKAKTQKRIVTAIFAGSATDDASENVDDDVHLARGIHGVFRGKAPDLDAHNDSDSALRTLEESIAVTRAQIDAFRVRLEQVEADTTRWEVELKRTHYADVRHASEREIRQRRSEASVQATIADLARDGTPVAGDRDRDVPHNWETMSLCDITREIVAGAIGWLFPCGRLGLPMRDDQNQSRRLVREVNDKYPPPAKKGGGLPLVRMSCSIILVSFALCAAVLRRMGLERWVRR